MTFQQRLKWVLQGGNLTVADLARWLDRPDPTVREWIDNGREPTGAPLDLEHVYALLELLETLIRKKLNFPVPRLSAAKRKEYILSIRKRVFP